MKLITIRRARLNDINSIYALAIRTKEFVASNKTRHFERDELKEWIRMRNAIVLVAETDNRIVGFLFGMIISKHWLMFDSITVIPSFRGKGIAKTLLKQLYSILQQRGVDYIQGLVNVTKRETRNFWKYQGFSEGKNFIWVEKYL
jgi:ribosomal protein S18 acetylase RimI-like enzyme